MNNTKIGEKGLSSGGQIQIVLLGFVQRSKGINIR